MVWGWHIYDFLEHGENGNEYIHWVQRYGDGLRRPSESEESPDRTSRKHICPMFGLWWENTEVLQGIGDPTALSEDAILPDRSEPEANNY